MKVMKILPSSSDLKQPNLNGSKRVGVLPKKFVQRRCDFVGVSVPVGEKADDHALLGWQPRCTSWAVKAPMEEGG
jgi:hypothetical protein